jgi:multiple sugar transport system ATP-binding protein
MDLYHHPQTRFVAGFIGQPNMNFIPATVVAADANAVTVEVNRSHQLQASVDGSSLKPGDNVEIGIRPEDITLTAEASGLPLQVSVVERLGGTSIIYGSLYDESKFCATVEGYAQVSEDKVAHLQIPDHNVHLFDANGNACRRLSAPDIQQLTQGL